MIENLAKCGCGSEAYAHMIGYMKTEGYYISCEECGMKTAIFETLEEAAKTWNTAMGKRTGECECIGFCVSQCTVCGATFFHELEYENFCPNCGVKWRGGHE